jgi:tetrahydromethanopterin S-methyltransferase subunit E
MNLSSLLVGFALGVCTFALAWATVRHYTGLAEEHGLALVIAIVVGLVVGVGYVFVESRWFDSWPRRSDR